MENEESENIQTNKSSELLVSPDLSTQNDKIFKDIFFYKEEKSNIIYYPLLKNTSEAKEKLKLLFSSFEDITSISQQAQINFISNKLSNFISLKEIISNSYEILQIIFNFLNKNKISTITYILDLYIHYLSITNTIPDNDVLSNQFLEFISWLVSAGFNNKNNYDHIYKAISKLQFENKLTKEKYENFLNILEILYGEYYDKNIKKNLVAKNFIYFYDKTTSMIETNISENNIILIENSCAFIFWLYLNQKADNNFNKCFLLQLEILNNLNIEFILNENFDIDVKVTVKNKNQIILLKEQNNSKFEVQKNKWIQLKIQIMKNGIKINLFQDEDLIKKNELLYKYDTGEGEAKLCSKKYDTKMYYINEKSSGKNNNILDFITGTFNISGMRFFYGYTGIVGTIIFCRNKNPSETPINCLYGLKNNKISNFLAEAGLSDIFFIFSPTLFMEDKNKFDYLSNNIIGIFNNSEILNNPNEMDLNGVYKYKNYINKIFEVGGSLSLLPLFEIFYKFTLDKNNNSLERIFIKLIKLFELVIVNKNKNYLDIYLDDNKLFLESLQLFLELINEYYYQQNDEILNTFINIGKYLYDNVEKMIVNSEIIEPCYYDYFKYILVYPQFILKYTLKQQNILWNFYNSLDDNKKFFMSFDTLGNFMILFSKKFNNESLPTPLMKIIKNIFKDKSISDCEREKLLLLYNSNLLSNKIIVDIIGIFESYLEIDTKKPKRNNTKLSNIFQEPENENILKINSVDYFLNSQNYFLETLLKILSLTDLKIKRATINLLRILTQKYSDIFEKYFNNINNENKKSKGKIKRITENEFYSFIEENILPNNNNKVIKDSNIYENYDSEIAENQNETGRKSSMDNINYFEKTENESEKYSKKDSNIKNKLKNTENGEKIRIKRSNSWYSENIEEIKFNFFNIHYRRNTENKPYNKIKRISVFELSDNTKQKSKQNKNNETIATNKINIKEEKINIEKKIEDENTNCEIVVLLIDWLIESSEKSVDKNENDKTKQKSNVTNIPLYDKIMNFITKFLHSNKNLKIIYKILPILISRKIYNITDNLITPTNNSYSKLLEVFSITKNYFVQLLIEFVINFYICIYDNNYKKKIENLIGQNLLEEECIKNIYNRSKEILLDIYFFEKNELRNNIIYDLINIILKLYDGLKNKKDIEINIRKICFNFLNEFFTEIIEIYEKKFALFNSIKDIQKDTQLFNEQNNLNKHFLSFTSFIFEYSLLLINSSDYIAKTFKEDYVNFYGIPDYFSYDSDKKRVNKNMDLYLKIFNSLKSFFDLSKVLSKMSTLFPTTEIKKIDTEIFSFEIFDINKLIKDLSTNKELQQILKKILEILFMGYENEDLNQNNNFPLISIISILSNYSIDLFIIDNVPFPRIHNLSLIQFLNNHQFFIICLILIDCIYKENDNFSNIKLNNKEIQDIIYENLLYCIANIIYCINSEHSTFFVGILNNIIAFMSCLYIKDSEKHKFSLQLKKAKSTTDFSKTSVKKILNYFSSKLGEFFNHETYKNFANNTKEKNKEIILIEMTKLYQNIIKNKIANEEQCNLFKLSKFESLYNLRRYEVNFKLKLFIEDKKSFDTHKSGVKNYKNIFLRVDKLKTPYNDNYLLNTYTEINKKNNYRKLKKQLYSWNNSYSDTDAFYKGLSNKTSTKILKYKLSNFLSSDMTRKLLSPVIDLDYYMPNFKSFDYKTKLFLQENPNEDTLKNIYSIDLKIFENTKVNLKNHDLKNYLLENVCYIKSGIHIRGKIFFIKNLENNNNYNENLFFVSYDQYTREYLLKNNPDYDSEHYTCFGSIFKNNSNKNTTEKFIKFNFNEILYIFIRKYCFRNNSIEIFTSNHKSYYFQFINNQKRDNFLSELISLLNKKNHKNKLFRSIKGIDESSKPTIIGYYRDEENINKYNNISNIKDLWKNNLISSLEYLMWINIYGNRSFRDIQQYPVFPWILNQYDYENYEELINNLDIRDFRFPMGMLYNDEKSQKRREGYIETYKIMVTDLYNENIINIKLKDEDEDINTIKYQNSQKDVRYSVRNNTFKDTLNIYNSNDVKNNKNERDTMRNESVYNIYFNNNFNINNERSTKITDYKFDLEKYYYDINFEYEKIPYCFGSHYSNGMYVSHYLARLFPYALTMIEIQGDGFDCAERLFLDFQKSFNNAMSEKGDLRELIPEIFTLPELFININKLDFGKIKIEEKETIINNVNLPEWCYKNPYFFTQILREIFELPMLNFNPWIDLTFGYTQKGSKAQQLCNLYLPYVYDGVINIRVKEEDLINNREDNEFRIRAFEMGVHPCKVFDKKNKSMKININNQINNIGNISFNNIPEIKIKNENKKIIFINFNEDLFLIDNKLVIQKLNIQEVKEAKELDKKYTIKEKTSFKELSIRKTLNKNIQSKLIIKLIFKNSLIIISGYFDGSLYMIKTPSNKNNPKNEEKANLFENLNIKILDNSLITALEIDKNEKFLIYGTIQGSLIIYNLNYNYFKENRKFYHLFKIIKSHNNYAINSISINNDLNLFADCSYDGFVNIYSLPKIQLVNSIFIDKTIYNFTIDYVFLSAQPLASIVLYSNSKYQFKCYSINGKELDSSETDTHLIRSKYDKFAEWEDSMNSPIIFTDVQFKDYLVYIFKKKYVIIRQFPTMKEVAIISPQEKNNKNEELLNMISISHDNKNLFILEEKSNKVYIANCKNKLKI